jgi:hypothetical protein
MLRAAARQLRGRRHRAGLARARRVGEGAASSGDTGRKAWFSRHRFTGTKARWSISTGNSCAAAPQPMKAALAASASRRRRRMSRQI